MITVYFQIPKKSGRFRYLKPSKEQSRGKGVTGARPKAAGVKRQVIQCEFGKFSSVMDR